MEEAISFAKKYLEDLLSFFGLNTDVYATREEDVIELSVPSTHLNGFLIGNRGDTLRAIQYLVASALRNQEMELSRVNVDIAGYKKQHNERLAEKAEGWAKKVRDKSEKRELEPMNASDRRVIHQAVGELSGVTTESHGEGRDRHIVILPTEDEEVGDEKLEAEKPEEAKEPESTEEK
jgi:spoIIIJ-associated protein